MFLNKDVSGRAYNRVVGVDANFRFFRTSDVNFAGAKTISPTSQLPGDGRRLVLESRLQLSQQLLGHARALSDHRRAVQRRDGVRAAHRRQQRRAVRRRALPAEVVVEQGWLRETFPHCADRELHARSDGGGLESRYMDWHWPVTLQNSTFIEVGVNPNIEVIRRAVHDQQPPQHQVLPGRYEFNEILRARQHQRRRAAVVQHALLDRRFLRRLPPRLHRRHDGSRQRALQRLRQRRSSTTSSCRRAPSRRR